VPTISFTLDAMQPGDLAQNLADRNIGVRDGHLFAPRLMDRLGLDMRHGACRVSLVHYNTLEEIARFEEALQSMR